ncbi:MAG: aldo/keto reductase [Jatrophihabitans sp.]|uniref:aldo/keto reductase n=1 Tax=Jatrophihabitans sp. TaxID=1932789 RepID=UPI003F7E8168
MGDDTTIRREGQIVTGPVPDILLNNGVRIPQFGFGVFQIKPEDTVEATLRAFEAGYRHIDTAEMYGNEAEVGEAVQRSGLPRDEVFITSKLNNGFHEPDAARKAFDETLSKLGVEQIDLFLIHWPLPTRYGGDFVSTWKTLEEFYRDGRARSIGVSNFQSHHLDRLAQETEVVPAVNQIEVHPYLAQGELRRYCAEHQIAVEAWSPIAQGKVLDDPTITAIAEKYGKSAAQIVLRWHIERGDIVFPKSVTPERIRENIAIFDFELDGDDVEAITALDRHERTGPDPDTFDYIPG